MLENIDNKATRGSISQIILKALSLSDKYGYEICKDIEKLSNGKLVLKQPSLYSCLRRMEEQKLISSYWKDSLLGGRRHYYSITEKGKQAYEENKINWKDEEELLNSLPSDITSEENVINEDNENLDDELDDNLDNQSNNNATKQTTSTPPNKTSGMFVLDQENLFNLARKKDEEIKKINATDSNDKNNSFFQFDFFEQNIKVVKKNNNVAKEDIQVFTNKFSNLDNHSQNIEPESKNTLNESNFNSSRINLSSITDKEIKRDEVSFSHTNSVNNEIEDNVPNSKNNIFDYMKIDKVEDDKNVTNNQEETEIFTNNLKFTNDDEIKRDDEVQLNKTASYDDITWEKQEYGDAPLFDHDYKSAIGKLYNNSQLKDPYEQNKFQTFKEIFPSSTLKEKEKTDIRQTKIDAVIQSSYSSNIDCDDIMMLNNLYNLQGLNIKIHNNIENNRQNKIYRDNNKLNMVCAWIIAFIGFAEFFISYLILSKNNLFLDSQGIIYICCSAILLVIGLFFMVKNLLDRYKLIIIKKNFTKIFVVNLLLFILCVVATFAINIAVGMDSLNQVEFLSFWLVPCLLFSNLLLFQFVCYLLLKTKFFYS